MLMVVDLQGIINKTESEETRIVLTDPAIHCVDPTRFGNMNLGTKGMQNFFKRHTCNKFCAGLGLEPQTKPEEDEAVLMPIEDEKEEEEEASFLEAEPYEPYGEGETYEIC
jgi:hypothetical protein